MVRARANEVKRRILLAIGALAATCCLTAGAIADPQGWNGPGWYVSGSAPPTSEPTASPAYLLFEGPHISRSDCIAVYDRFYSPVGICRFLSAKPGG
jgi:hypothetical protein